MNRRRTDIRILALLVLGLVTVSMILLSSSPSFTDQKVEATYTIENEEAKGKIIQAFKAVADAEEKGGDVSPLVIELNSAIDLAQEAESANDEDLMKKALSRLDEVIEKAPKVGEQGLAAAQWRQITSAVALCIEASTALIAYVYAPQAFWRIWIRVKGKWNVKAVERR